MSWQSALASWVLRRKFRPETAKPGINVERARAATSKRIWSPKVSPGWVFSEHYALGDAPLRGEWLAPVAPAGSTILYLHGGGYYFCSPKSHRGIVFALAKRSGARVFSLDYRLAPEHPFPAALDDAVAAYRRLIADGVPAQSIVIAGDSAGGGLALAMLLALRDAGDAMPAGGVLLSPWTDLASSGETFVTNNGRDPMFYGAVFRPVAQLYLGNADARNPLASPVYGDFSGLPPLLIHVGDTEVLLSDSTRVADSARAAGVGVELKIWPAMPHVFQMYAPFMPEANRALDEAAAFIQRLIGKEN
jgi:monoterpene epsilon-lactone hydrolase